MSMMYCEACDRNWDSDWHESCPECQQAEWDELTTVELILHGAVPGMWKGLWAVACKPLTEEAREHYTIPAHADEWRIIYQSTDMHRVMRDAMDLAKGATHFAYAVVTPNLDEE